MFKHTWIEHKIGNDRTTNSTDLSDLFRAKRDLSELCIKYGQEVVWGIQNEILKMLSIQTRNKDEKKNRESEKKKIQFCCKMYALSDCPKLLTIADEAYKKSKEGCAEVISKDLKCEDVVKDGSPVLASSSAIFIIAIISFYGLYLA
jgi:hypothetical protein